jgi:hypothetical protein
MLFYPQAGENLICIKIITKGQWVGTIISDQCAKGVQVSNGCFPEGIVLVYNKRQAGNGQYRHTGHHDGSSEFRAEWYVSKKPQGFTPKDLPNTMGQHRLFSISNPRISGSVLLTE